MEKHLFTWHNSPDMVHTPIPKSLVSESWHHRCISPSSRQKQCDDMLLRLVSQERGRQMKEQSSHLATNEQSRGRSMTWQDVHHQLQSQRDAIVHEIRHYPPPIPACDVQYNYLLEQRDKVLRELRLLRRMEPTDPIQLEAFAAASSFVNHHACSANHVDTDSGASR